MFELREVQTKSEWSDFIGMPWGIYQGDSYWVPPLRIAIRDLLNTKKNPFFRHACMYPLVAYMGKGNKKKCVGRILGVIDENHNRFHDEKTAFFGFFESIDNLSLSHLMFSKVEDWAKQKHMHILRGPVNPSTNHECGLLVDGFNDSPAVMMTYNPRYYVSLIEGSNFLKVKDLYSYQLTKSSKFSERLFRHSERLKEKASISFRCIELKNFDREIDQILEIYNDAWEKNWGFVPMEPTEFRHMAKDIKAVMDPLLCLVAEVRGKPAGFALALPDVNQAIQKIKDGRLFPFGLFKLFWYLKGPNRRKIVDRCRIVTLGIKREYRELGIGSLFYTEYVRTLVAMGYSRGEASWILEDNKSMNRALEMMCGERNKVYRIYEKSLLNV